MADQESTTKEVSPFLQKVLVTLGAVLVAAFFISLLVVASNVFLLVFAGIVLAVFLRGSGSWVGRKFHVSGGWGVVIVISCLVIAFGVGMLFLIPHVAEQVELLMEEIPKALDQIEKSLGASQWGRQLLQLFPDMGDLAGQLGNVFKEARGIFSTFLGAVTSVVIIIFVGLYLSVEPGLYQEGVVRLFPKSKRDRCRQILEVAGFTLSRWLIGRIIGMAVIGIFTWLGLMLLGIPLALSLGLFAGIMTFIPNIGPVISVIPAILLALMQGFDMVIWVSLLYLGLQTVESYIITPLIQQHTVLLPPVFLITTQLIMGLLLGILGLFLAGPLAAVGLAMTKMIYVEDVLGDEVRVKGED